MISHAITSAAAPIRAVITGSPVLAARLWAPTATRRDQAAEVRATLAKAITAARAAELAKLTDEKAIAKAKAAHAAADKAARAAKRERIGSALGGGALVAIVAGPVSWQLVGPWMPVATWTGIGLWCVAAMAHAPSSRKAAPEPALGEPPAAALDDADEWIQDSPPEDVLWALIRHTAALTKQGTAAHLQAVLEEGQRRGQFEDWTVADLAEELASYGVPVVEGKKLTVGGRQLNRKAVLLANLPEAEPAPFPVLVQPAAQSAA